MDAQDINMQLHTSKIQHESRDKVSQKDLAWYSECMEIIDRCVHQSVYHEARAMLEQAMKRATTY